jgi:RNA polymerase sigma-70 factor (sigma-E family)
MADDFAEYVVRRYDGLCRTAYLLTRDWAVAEDLVQTSLAKAWAAWSKIEGDPDRYVYRIIANTHASWWQRRWRGEVPTDAVPEEFVERDFAGIVVDHDALWAAIGILSKRQRTVIVLHYFDELTLQQVSETLGCSLSTVKTQLSRGLARLRMNPEIQDLQLEATI